MHCYVLSGMVVFLMGYTFLISNIKCLILPKRQTDSIQMGSDVGFVRDLLKFSSHVIHFLDLIAPEL